MVYHTIPTVTKDVRFSFGPGAFHYQAFACYDLLNGGNQTLKEYGVWVSKYSSLEFSLTGLPEVQNIYLLSVDWRRLWIRR